MSMNKTERAELERAKTQAALRWTAPVDTDVPPPIGVGVTSGYSVNPYSMAVTEAWSTSTLKGSGLVKPVGYSCGSQGSISLYSTKLLAMRALRNQIEEECARKLRSIDLTIEKELSGES